MAHPRRFRNTRPISQKSSHVAAGIAVVGAGIMAVSPVTAPLAGINMPEIELLSSNANMVLDLVRHGQSLDNVQHILGTTPPGAPLTDVGRDQAVAVGEALYNNGDNNIDGVYASEFLRTQQTAWPLIQLLSGQSVDADEIPNGPTPLFDPSHVLAGLNELNAGTLEGVVQDQNTGLEYLQAPLHWMMGELWVPQLGSTTDVNGMAFNDRFTDAIDQIYNNAGDPDADGNLNSVAFSHAAAISTWVMMNVKNPDFDLYSQMLRQGILANTGQVVLEGNPTDGWTLVSWNGIEVAQDQGLATNLFVDFRDLIMAPQMAGWHIWEALQGGDLMATLNAVQTGFSEVSTALMEFPDAVINHTTAAIEDLFKGLPIIEPSDVS